MLRLCHLRRRLASALGVVFAVALLGSESVGAQQPTPTPQPPPPTAAPTAAGDRDTSEAARAARRLRRAVEQPLFASDTLLRLTLVADLRALRRQQDTIRPKRFPGLVHVAGASGTATLPVTLHVRGHWRLRTCGFPPLRVVFDSGTGGTPFARQEGIKLVTHCGGGGRDADEFVLRESLAYRAVAMATPHAFRSRLARVRYVDARDPATADTTRAEEHLGLFLESDRTIAVRLGGSEVEQQGARFDDIAPDSGVTLALAEYFLGNTDWSLAARHNVRLVGHPAQGTLAIPYDFDFTGLVNTGYGVPDARLPIRTVRQRLWRGPCASAATLAAATRPWLAQRAAIEALWTTPTGGAPALDPRYARDARRYVREFYDAVSDAEAMARRTRDEAKGCPPTN